MGVMTEVPTTWEPDTTMSNTSFIDDASSSSRSLTWLVVVGIIYGLIILLTLVGNAFVMAAFALDAKIRARPANLFILHLCISDFCVGVTLIFNFVFLAADEWRLGEIPCKFWIVLDYVNSYMSVIAITLISLDRYWMVKKKLAYRKFQTRKRVSITLAVCWGVVISFYTITAFGYGAMTKTNHVDFSNDCEMEYLYNIPFSVTMIFVEFVIPFILIVYLNIVVYVNIKMRSGGLVRSKEDPRVVAPSQSTEKLKKRTGHDSSRGLSFMSKLHNAQLPIVTISYSVNTTSAYDLETEKEKGDGKDRISLLDEENEGFPGEHTNQGADINFDYCNHNVDLQPRSDPDSTGIGEDAGGENRLSNSTSAANGEEYDDHSELSNGSRLKETQLLSASALTLQSMTLSLEDNNSRSRSPAGSQEHIHKRSREFRRYRRAARLLFVLVITFAICWLPYQITTAIMTIAGDDAVPEVLSEIMTNLLWCNSTINPFLYAVVTSHFRRNFLKFLGLQNFHWCHKQGGNSTSDVAEKSEINTANG